MLSTVPGASCIFDKDQIGKLYCLLIESIKFNL